MLDSLFAAFLREPLADLVASPRALHEIEPPLTRSRIRALRGENLNHVAAAQGALQRHQATVYLGAHGAVTNLGVHGVSEVDGGGAGGQADHLALRREHVHLFSADFEAQRIEELVGIGGLRLPVRDMCKPRHLGVAARPDPGSLAAIDALLVLPVRRDAELRTLMHLLGADLDLHRPTVRSDHRGVQ